MARETEPKPETVVFADGTTDPPTVILRPVNWRVSEDERDLLRGPEGEKPGEQEILHAILRRAVVGFSGFVHDGRALRMPEPGTQTRPDDLDLMLGSLQGREIDRLSAIAFRLTREVDAALGNSPAPSKA